MRRAALSVLRRMSGCSNDVKVRLGCVRVGLAGEGPWRQSVDVWAVGGGGQDIDNTQGRAAWSRCWRVLERLWSKNIRWVVGPVYHREKTGAGSGSCRSVLESMARCEQTCFEVEDHQDSCVVRLGEILDGLDDLVGGVFASNTMLHQNTQRGHCLSSSCCYD